MIELRDIIAFAALGYVALLILVPILTVAIGIPALWLTWTWKTYKKRKTSLLLFQVAAILGLAFWLSWTLSIFPCSEAHYERKMIHELTGQSFNTNSLTFSYEGTRHFNGDGYSILRYSLNEKEADLFRQPSPSFLNDYPIKGSGRSHWQYHQTWLKTPSQIPPAHLNFILWETNLLEDDSAEMVELRRNYDEVRTILSEPGNYYAYTYSHLQSGYPANIDFFILSPSQQRLIIINHNT